MNIICSILIYDDVSNRWRTHVLTYIYIDNSNASDQRHQMWCMQVLNSCDLQVIPAGTDMYRYVIP